VDKCCAEKLRRVLRLKNAKFVILFGLIFFSIMTVLNLVKYVRTRKRIMPTLAGLVMVFVTAVIYFEIYVLIIPALIAFFLVGMYAIVDVLAGKTFPEEIAEKLERIEREPKWYDFLTWKPLLTLRDKFGNLIATIVYSVVMSALVVVGFIALATMFELPIHMATVGVLAMVMFVSYSLNIYRALKRLEGER